MRGAWELQADKIRAVVDLIRGLNGGRQRSARSMPTYTSKELIVLWLISFVLHQTVRRKFGDSDNYPRIGIIALMFAFDCDVPHVRNPCQLRATTVNVAFAFC